MKVEEVFKRVRIRVEAETRGDQTPWESASLMGDFYFVPPKQRLHGLMTLSDRVVERRSGPVQGVDLRPLFQ